MTLDNWLFWIYIAAGVAVGVHALVVNRQAAARHNAELDAADARLAELRRRP